MESNDIPITNAYITSDDSDSEEEFVLSISVDKEEEERDDIDDYRLYDEMDEEEISDNQAIKKCENMYDIDDHIFNPTEMD